MFVLILEIGAFLPLRMLFLNFFFGQNKLVNFCFCVQLTEVKTASSVNSYHIFLEDISINFQ